MNELFNLSHWVVVLAQNGLVILGQTSLILGLGLLVLRVLQKRQPILRDLLGRALLVATLAGGALSLSLSMTSWSRPPALWNVSLPATPTVLTAMPEAPFSALPRSGTSLAEPRPLPPATQNGTEKQSASLTVGETAAGSTSQAPQIAALLEGNNSRRLLYLAVGVWIGGAFGLIVWWGMCHVALRGLRRGAHHVEDATTLATLNEVCVALKIREPLLLWHPKVSSPFLTGLVKPAILLPTSNADLDSTMLRAIFSHEAMHLKRRDLWWNAVGRVGCALLWPQPLLWMLCRQVEHSSEEACDQAVLEAGCSRQQYAKCLLDFAERLSPRKAERVAGIGVLTDKSSLSHRIPIILSTSQTRAQKISTRARWLIGVGTLVCVLAMPFLVSGSVAPQPLSKQSRKFGGEPRIRHELRRNPQAAALAENRRFAGLDKWRFRQEASRGLDPKATRQQRFYHLGSKRAPPSRSFRALDSGGCRDLLLQRSSAFDT